MTTESKKNYMAMLSFGLSLLGCVLGYFTHTDADSFAPGMAVTFVAYLISLMSVQDKGHNILAKTAFFLSTAALIISAWFSAVR